MTMKPTLIASACTLALAAASVPAQAQSKKEFEALRKELQLLRAEVAELKKAHAAEQAQVAQATQDAKAAQEKAAQVQTAQAEAAKAKPTEQQAVLNDRVEALEIKSKDSVVKGDIDGSFRLPGSETSVKIYGYAEAHAIHDFGKKAPDDLFTNLMFQPTPSEAAGDPSLAQKGKTSFTASTSRFGFDTSTPTRHGTFNTRIEADFYSYGEGNRNRLRLRHAYGEYAGFLVGQTWSTFMDVDDLPETVDFNGPIGSPFSRRAMLRYTWGDAKAGYKFAFAAEDPHDQFGGGSSGEKMPELVARFDKSFDWGAVNIRALSHEKRSFAETRRGYGFGIGGSYKLSDKDTLLGQFAVVKGDFDQMYGSNGYSIDPDTGAITMDRNKGFVLGYAKVFNEQLRGNLVLGYNRASTATGNLANKRLTQVHAGVIYSPFKNVELGAEAIYGLRETFDDEKGRMGRIDLMGRYSF
ncbi:MAG TPA: DcaP family trimeric outer membrane transporter [Burkholderiaceae bacterium]